MLKASTCQKNKEFHKFEPHIPFFMPGQEISPDIAALFGRYSYGPVSSKYSGFSISLHVPSSAHDSPSNDLYSR